MTPKPSKLKNRSPQNLVNQQLVDEALGLGCTKAKVILTRTIAVGAWVKLKCQFGCPHYGKLLTCPPCSPTSDETSEILADYQKALLIHADSEIDMRGVAVELEGRLKGKGFIKAFGICAEPCDLCEVCTIEQGCKYPDKARPTMQACGININQTVSNNGWEDMGPVEPCSTDKNIGMVLID